MTKKAVHKAFKIGNEISIADTLLAYYRKINFYRKPEYSPSVARRVFGQ